MTSTQPNRHLTRSRSSYMFHIRVHAELNPARPLGGGFATEEAKAEGWFLTRPRFALATRPSRSDLGLIGSASVVYNWLASTSLTSFGTGHQRAPLTVSDLDLTLDFSFSLSDELMRISANRTAYFQKLRHIQPSFTQFDLGHKSLSCTDALP